MSLQEAREKHRDNILIGIGRGKCQLGDDKRTTETFVLVIIDCPGNPLPLMTSCSRTL